MSAPLRMISVLRFGRPVEPRVSYPLANLVAAVMFVLLPGLAQTRAQTPAGSVSGVDAALIEDIVVGSRILAEFGVLDGFGHVSARDPKNPNRFLMSRSLAPATSESGWGFWDQDRKSTRLNSSHANISYAVFCLKKNKKC